MTTPASSISDRSDSLPFEPENEGQSSTQLTPIDINMDHLKRARVIKKEIENNISVLMPPEKITSTRRNDYEDPENIIIKTLRQEQKLSWNEIANYLNQERLVKGEAATFTDAAVYSRFVRNAPQVATSVDEIGFDPKDYMHLRHPNQYTQAEGTGGISKVGKKRVKNYDNATELKVNMRQVVSHDNELEDMNKTEQLMEAVAKCERNFWRYVADEMERATAKMYDHEELASRYHAI
ncbi:hypothetical protein G6011_00178 [Alternaria panax]|uniref:Uncharacterized protein n=1 Tax=Alternaria panax TaxID=48097 RepID=A0AAD4IIF4_9PLEO|nr:hypothetical protein G6011_00178 [Alternaria panax]